ncbi:MAG: prolipoprotein diacylglyceryl transferase, partial [Clostridiales bacterium]|nr:prolipoprotein diacylglyceryl transferase [Clostridiales bacterium]
FIGIDDNGLQGLAIYGGLIGAVIGGFLLSLWKKRKKNQENKRVSFLQLLDLGFVFIILGQAIGRWGNFANEEAYGYMITDTSLMHFPLGVEIDGVWHYATFFYESMWNFLGFAILYFLYAGKFKSFDGFVFSCYCIYYGIGRSWIEGMRSDSLWLVPPTVPGTDGMPDVGGIRVSQLVSILLIAFGVAYIVAHIIRAKRAGKKIFIFVRRDKLNDSYFEYDKTKLAHPMPDIKFWKDRHNRKDKGEEIIIDNNGVAIRVDPNAESESGDGEKAQDTVTDSADAVEEIKEKHTEKEQVTAEDAYEDKWDD